MIRFCSQGNLLKGIDRKTAKRLFSEYNRKLFMETVVQIHLTDLDNKFRQHLDRALNQLTIPLHRLPWLLLCFYPHDYAVCEEGIDA